MFGASPPGSAAKRRPTLARDSVAKASQETGDRLPPPPVAVLLLVLVGVWALTELLLLLPASIGGAAVPRAALGREAVLSGPTPNSVHVVLTSNGNSYMNWQSRVMYATYLAVVAQDPTGPLARGAFTRVLHRSTPDELMEEIPTLRFTPVHVNCDTYCSFPVADRSPALVEWMATEDAGRCSHIMLVETDYLWVKSLSADLLPSDGTALAFPYSYIVPTYPTVAPYSAKYYSGPVGDIPPTGNAPVLLTRADFGKLVPEWARIVAEIEEDEVAVERLGWVRDMYAWSFAAVRTGIKHHMPMPPLNELMVQPPADTELGKAALLHYTWGPVIYNSSDALIWEFDKRSYCGGQYAIGPRLLEKIPEPPAWQQGLHLQSFFAIGNAITPSGLELMRLFVHTFNQAVEALPELPKGWSDRAAAEAAAKPSPESQVLADKVQAEIAAREEEKKKAQQGRKD